MATTTEDPNLAAVPDPEPENPQLPIAGAQLELDLEAGGRLPESSSIKLRGGSLALEGQFRKGETVAVWVECRIAEVHFVDRVDAHGEATGAERRHVAKMIRVQRA
jgi:hypothetical protein